MGALWPYVSKGRCCINLFKHYCALVGPAIIIYRPYFYLNQMQEQQRLQQQQLQQQLEEKLLRLQQQQNMTTEAGPSLSAEETTVLSGDQRTGSGKRQSGDVEQSQANGAKRLSTDDGEGEGEGGRRSWISFEPTYYFSCTLNWIVYCI